MNAQPASRERKKRILSLLADPGWEAGLPALADMGQAAISPLFSALCNASPLVRWRAVTAFGLVVADMASKTPEKARIVMRRLIWSLNDESGGIGWGAPEAMAEISCQSRLMALEFHNYTLAYIHEEHCRPDCYLEHALLRRGAVWGVGRLAQVRPDLAVKAESDLLLALDDPDGVIRGLSAWACGLLRLQAALPRLEQLRGDASPLELYRDRQLIPLDPATLAQEAILGIAGHFPANNP